MDKLLKLTDMNKFFTAIKIADTIRNCVYAGVILLMIIKIIKIFKAFSNS